MKELKDSQGDDKVMSRFQSKFQLTKKINNSINKIKEDTKSRIDKIKEDIALSQDLNRFINEWKDIMYELGLHTETYNTYTLLNIEKKPYGYCCNIYATKGLNLDDLEKAKSYIETGIGCIFLFYVKKGKKTAEAKFITEGFGGDKIKFIPPKTTQFELYLGNSVDGTPVIISAKEVSHFLLSGSNGSGKSRMLDCMITTLIHNCNELQLELYLAQIAKNDLVIYEDAKCCRAFCETLDEVEIMLSHIIKKMEERSKLIKPMRKDFKGSDISDYNKLHPSSPLSVCWVIFDEIASIMDKTGDEKDITKLKSKITKMIEEIARVGRALGIFLGVCIQRPTAQMLSPTVKSQTNLKISFSQNNIKSSEVATDDPNIAIGLDERVAVYSCRAKGFDFVKTPFINDSIIAEYVKPKSQRGHRDLFSDLEKLNKKPQPPKLIPNSTNMREETVSKPTDKGTAPLPSQIKEIKKEENISQEQNNKKDEATMTPKINTTKLNVKTPNGIMDFSAIDNTKTTIDEKIKENINNIPNYVPYEPINTKIVIDQTNLSLFKTQKPIKNKE